MKKYISFHPDRFGRILSSAIQFVLMEKVRQEQKKISLLWILEHFLQWFLIYRHARQRKRRLMILMIFLEPFLLFCLTNHIIFNLKFDFA
jgi:hypothetical protein